MAPQQEILQPMPYSHRNGFFRILLGLFIVVLPILYLYATGYRFEFGDEATLISTGGIYVAAERTGAEIYIDNELVRETRVFRTAFYAQSIEPGTHRVHVQKEGHHTWVKELPVYPHIVTEAQAFNLPLVPQVRTISPWSLATGEVVLFASSTLHASSTNEIFVSSTTATSTFVANTEYEQLHDLFATVTATSSETLRDRVVVPIDTFLGTTTATSTEEQSTSTKESSEVRLYESAGVVRAEWIGSREDMPYYYCAEDFELLGTATSGPGIIGPELQANTAELLQPVQEIPENALCEPTIEINTAGQEVHAFDFFPGSNDFVILALEDGIYVVEVDERAWQNRQPLLLGEGLDMRIENGAIFVYDETLIYEVEVE